MSVFVVDASLVVKWFVPEVHSDAARRWLDAAHDYLAPDLLFPEAGNALWKKVRRQELATGEAQRLAADISRVAVESVSMRGLVADAHALAVSAGVTVYDATYLTLAVRLESQVVTADDRLRRMLAEDPVLSGYVRWVEDLVESQGGQHQESYRRRGCEG